MIAPGTKQIIQIIVTNRCDLMKCSNCTQMLTHQNNRYDMSPAVFRAACESLADWTGVLGVFGGNPCVSPHFAEYCSIITEVIPDQKRRGLWSNHFRGKGAFVREAFWPDGYFNLNVHAHPDAAEEMERWVPGRVIGSSINRTSWHSPILVAIKDIIPDPVKMWQLIESCDININWSGAIIERDGKAKAYFCEVAAAFDLVYGEDNGIDASPGWWRKDIKDFDHQIKRWCPNCGIPLRLRGHKDLDFTDDISKTHEGLITADRKHELHTDTPTGLVTPTDYQRLRSA